MLGSGAPERNASIRVATLLFGVFGVLAMLVGVVDVVNPIYPWGLRLLVLGQVALVVGGVSFMATGWLWRLKRVGGYLAIIAFGIAFAVNVYVGEHLILHVVAGVIAGLVLLVPLALGWKHLVA